MANLSNCNTQSHTTNNTIAKRPLFKAGDAVLCPSLGYGAKPFILHKYEYHSELLCIHAHCSSIAFDSNGYFIQADNAQIGDIETNDYAPSLFIDTPENRQYIAGLYGFSKAPNVITTSKNLLNRKVIDLTQDDDDEVITLSALELSNIACDISGSITVLNDIGQLLALINYEKIEPHTAISMARLSHDAADTWAILLNDPLEAVNDTLAMTRYGQEGK